MGGMTVWGVHGAYRYHTSNFLWLAYFAWVDFMINTLIPSWSILGQFQSIISNNRLSMLDALILGATCLAIVIMLQMKQFHVRWCKH